MSYGTEGKFTSTWIVCTVRELYAMKNGSSKMDSRTLKSTEWYLHMNRLPSFDKCDFGCFLVRAPSYPSAYETITATFKLELINDKEHILKSTEYKHHFFNGSFCEIEDFLDFPSLELYKKEDEKYFQFKSVTIRCHIIDENYNKQVIAVEVPELIRCQWKIKTPEHSNWSKQVKVPFSECTHIDIIMSDSDERINIKIEKLDFIQPYALKITVLNNDDCEIDFKNSKNLFQSTDGKNELETWIEKSELVNKSQCHLPYSFTLICVLSMASGKSPSDSIGASLPSKMASPLPLQEDLKEMLLKAKHGDVKLKSQDKVIPVHKCLLSARSPVFCTMFDQDMLENQTGIVDIPDVEHGTLVSFTEFLYTDTVTNTDIEEVLKLMLVADKYQVNALKERCSIILMSSLSLENLCEILSVSKMVNQENLISCALNFIKENKTTIITSPVWSEWMKKNKDLANEILVKLIVN